MLWQSVATGRSLLQLGSWRSGLGNLVSGRGEGEAQNQRYECLLAFPARLTESHMNRDREIAPTGRDFEQEIERIEGSNHQYPL